MTNGFWGWLAAFALKRCIINRRRDLDGAAARYAAVKSYHRRLDGLFHENWPEPVDGWLDLEELAAALLAQPEREEPRDG